MLLLLLYCLLLLLYAILGIRASPPSPPVDSYAFAYFFPVHLQFAKRARCSFDGLNVKRILLKKKNSKYGVFYFIEFIARASGIIRNVEL